MPENYNILIKKLDRFIRKYYTSKLIGGSLISIAAIGLIYLIFVLIEYYSFLDTVLRSILFYLFLIFSLLLISGKVFLPIIRIIKLGKSITYRQAAEIIGKHFPDIDDKLLNTIQLQQNVDLNIEKSDLLIAGIEQKINEIKYFNFNLAIDFSINRKYLKYALFPVLFIFLLLFINPGVLTESSNRIINYNIEYEKPLKFKIEILNKKLEAVQQDDYRLNISVKGEEIPGNISIRYNNNFYDFAKVNSNLFYYTFRNIQSNIKFTIVTDNFESVVYEIEVFPKPIVLSFETLLDYPEYTQKKDKTIKNNGDITVPEGTDIEWNIFTKDADTIYFKLNNKSIKLDKRNSNVFSYEKIILKDYAYSIKVGNRFLISIDSLNYKISCIKDAYPQIFVTQIRDTITKKFLYFNGDIQDDYGFSKLFFKYSVSDRDEKNKQWKKFSVDIDKEKKQNRFYYSFNLSSASLNAGDKIEYFFEIWDNDEINGSKSARSQLMQLRIPSAEDIEKKINKSTQNIEDILEKSIRQTKKLKKDAEKMIKELINKDKLNWKEKEKIEDMLMQQKLLNQKIENAVKKLKDKNNIESELIKRDDRLVEKQKMLEELFNKIMSEDIKELFKEIQNRLDKINKDDVKKMLEDIKMSNEEIEKELDKNLELFKQLEFEKMLNDAIDKLNKLAEKENRLSEETKSGETDKKDLLKDQDEISKDFEQLRKDIDALNKKNQELENKHKMPNTEAEESEISKDLQESSKMLNKGRMNKASDNQKNASEKMQKMADFLLTMQQNMMMEQQTEDVNALREILENLLHVSFDQEILIGRINKTAIKNPKYLKIMKEQGDLRDNMKMIEDSLFALSKRQMQIEHFVSEEIEAINRNMEKVISRIKDRKVYSAAEGQQYVMTHINNLALMLAEVLKKMEDELSMQKSMSGKGSCSKPGKSGGSATSLKKLQQQLNRQLKEMQGGKNKGGKSGNKQFGKSRSEQFARMAAKQAAIREKMQKYMEGLKEQGVNDRGLLESAQKMEKTERELVNRILNRETLERQQQILTKLLKSEKAELKREKEKRRKSDESKSQKISNPLEYLEYKKIKNNETEMLKSVPLKIKPYYKELIDKYFYEFQSLDVENEEVD